MYEKISAPKNMTSVAMKTHMPSCAVSACCALSVYCSCRRPLNIGFSATQSILSDEAAIARIVAVGHLRHERRAREVALGRRRRGPPFETGGAPRIGSRALAVEDRPREVDERQHVGDREDGCARRREDVPGLQVRRIGVVAPRHTQVTEDELRQKGEVEADEGEDGRI